MSATGGPADTVVEGKNGPHVFDVVFTDPGEKGRTVVTRGARATGLGTDEDPNNWLGAWTR